MKNNKSPGSDEVTLEIFKYGGSILRKKLSKKYGNNSTYRKTAQKQYCVHTGCSNENFTSCNSETCDPRVFNFDIKFMHP